MPSRVTCVDIRQMTAGVPKVIGIDGFRRELMLNR